jgi:hypothetical protein
MAVWDVPLQDGDLLAKCEHLDGNISTALEEDSGAGDHAKGENNGNGTSRIGGVAANRFERLRAGKLQPTESRRI